MINRRAFLNRLGSAAAGVLLTTNLPLSLPIDGPMHDGARAHLLNFLSRQFNDFIERTGRVPKWVSLGRRALQQFEVELREHQRLGPDADLTYIYHYRFKNARVRERGRGWEWEMSLT